MSQVPSCAAYAEHMEDSVEHRLHWPAPWTTNRGGTVQHCTHHSPLGIGQAGCVGSAFARKLNMSGGRPHLRSRVSFRHSPYACGTRHSSNRQYPHPVMKQGLRLIAPILTARCRWHGRGARTLLRALQSQRQRNQLFADQPFKIALAHPKKRVSEIPPAQGGR